MRRLPRSYIRKKQLEGKISGKDGIRWAESFLRRLTANNWAHRVPENKIKEHKVGCKKKCQIYIFTFPIKAFRWFGQICFLRNVWYREINFTGRSDKSLKPQTLQKANEHRSKLHPNIKLKKSSGVEQRRQ